MTTKASGPGRGKALCIALVALAVSLSCADAAARPRHHHGGHHGSRFSVFIGYGPGYFVPRLPPGYARVGVGGLSYFYAGGIFYGPAPGGYVMVGAPIGAVVPVLPPVYEVVVAGPATYYQAGAAWYAWDPMVGGYRVVSPPQPPPPGVAARSAANEIYFYPARGQDERQQQQDRYECHQWAVGESHFDPSVSQQPDNLQRYRDYQRAITACLVGRGYTAG